MSFWGSYLGCIATVILSAAALRLSREINKYAWRKNMADEITSFHQFHVQEISLYDLSVDYPDEIDYFPVYKSEGFLLAVSFEAFPPYYDIELQPLEIFSCDVPETQIKLDSVQWEIVNTGAHHHFYCLFNAGKDLQEFMLLHMQGPNTKPHAQRHRCIHLSMRCKNTLYNEDPGYYKPFAVDLRIWASNAKAARAAPVETTQHTKRPLPLGIVKQTVSCNPVS